LIVIPFLKELVVAIKYCPFQLTNTNSRYLGTTLASLETRPQRLPLPSGSSISDKNFIGNLLVAVLTTPIKGSPRFISVSAVWTEAKKEYAHTRR
jgi:hypothetical protein